MSTSTDTPNIDHLYQALFAGYAATNRAFATGDTVKAVGLAGAFHEVADLITLHTGLDPRTDDGEPVDRRV